MKILNVILCIIFLLFLGVQYNDPDPYLWIPIYGFVAVVCGFAAVQKYNKTLILIGLSILSVYTLTYIPDFIAWIKMGMPNIVETMKAEKSYIELTREFGGLVVCDVALLWQFWQTRKALT
ncbi:MAG: transmembrane 220 family protein [Saprospiraceae bacterium]|nr:transmembrane 220 family protein [Saprospiraceae bacterium]